LNEYIAVKDALQSSDLAEREKKKAIKEFTAIEKNTSHYKTQLQTRRNNF
jgi:hypothetical protein